MFRSDPGPCPVCGAAHTACTPGSGPILVEQLPQRDAAARTSPDRLLGTEAAPASDAGDGDSAPAGVPIGDGSDERPFTTATYRGRKKPKGR